MTDYEQRVWILGGGVFVGAVAAAWILFSAPGLEGGSPFAVVAIILFFSAFPIVLLGAAVRGRRAVVTMAVLLAGATAYTGVVVRGSDSSTAGLAFLGVPFYAAAVALAILLVRGVRAWHRAVTRRYPSR